LSSEPLHIDDLCQQAGLPITQVSSTLAIMELKGMVRRLEGMQYMLARGGGETYRLD
jgi:DNA processing protein